MQPSEMMPILLIVAAALAGCESEADAPLSRPLASRTLQSTQGHQSCDMTLQLLGATTMPCIGQ